MIKVRSSMLSACVTSSLAPACMPVSPPSQDVPSVYIAYSAKFIGVMETIGIKSIVADARRLNKDAILEVVGRSYDREAVIHQQLERKMPELKASVLGLFRDMQCIRGDECVSGFH